MWIDLIIVRRRTGLRSPSITGGPGMVEVTVRDGIAVFEVEGVDKLWALKSHLEIPLAHIRDIRLDAKPRAAGGTESRRPARMCPE